MQKLLVFTDIHITEAGEEIIGLNPAARFSAALSHALDRHPDAEGIVLLGDLTHHGRPAQFRRLRALLESCPLPVYATLGNHDIADAFARVFPDQVDEGGFAQHAFDLGPVRVIILDTHDRDGHAPQHGGWLCEARLAWLDREMRQAEGRPVLLACHHPAIRTGFDGMDSIDLANGAALMGRVRVAESPVHLLFGHVHRTISGSVDGTGFSILKSPCHQMPMALGPGSHAVSIDEPGAYGIVLGHDKGVIVHSEDVLAPVVVHEDPASE